MTHISYMLTPEDICDQKLYYIDFEIQKEHLFPFAKCRVICASATLAASIYLQQLYSA